MSDDTNDPFLHDPGLFERSMTDAYMIALLRQEIIRQSKADDGPWIAVDPSETTVRVDGTLDLAKLAEAIGRDYAP